ncbi:type I restriction enzyme, S subunit [Lactococcus chungangensis CAU 28 = DSM 22330]|nr:type I restriction enzyme, S subunit [Lactococcus chungangensis CAU 28 = DSM 22330]
MSKKSPQLRFEGFTDDWEQRKLKDIVNRVTRKNKNLESTLPLTISAQYGLVDQITFFNKQIASKDMSGYYLLQKGEFAYNKSYSKDFPWGAIKRLNMYDEGVLSTLYIAFLPFKVNSDFLVSYYETDGWHKEVAIRAAEGARNHGLLNITAVDFFDTGLMIPPNNDEQQEIGGFFIELDHTITLHQRKLDLLKEQKKGFLQKMFPKNGAKVPELRFAGFADDWEERKLGDVFSERSERSSEGELISVTINSGVVKASELDRKDNSSNDKSNYKKVEVGDIAYNSMRMWQGASGYSSYDGILSPAYTVIIPKEGTDSKFFAYDFKRHDMIQTFKRNSQGLTSDTWNLKFPTLKSVKVMVPCMEEQTKISNFFERLDTTITLHQRKLDLLKEQKKGFLQKMFV